MKKFTPLILYGLMLCISFAANAKSFEVDGIWYDEINSESVAVARSGGNPYSGKIEIPSAVTYQGRDYSVDKISSFAFAEGSQEGDAHLITSVAMGDNIKAIEEGAFQYCMVLRSVSI